MGVGWQNGRHDVYDSWVTQVRIANPVAGSGSLDRVFSDTALVWHRYCCLLV